MALVTDDSVNENAMVVARSVNGGRTWSPPAVIMRSPAQDRVARSLFHDKNTLTADPHQPRFVYATWTVFRSGISSVVFSRSTDGGLTWSPAVPIATMGSVARAEKALFRQGAQIVVLPDGTLINAFFRTLFDDASQQSDIARASDSSINGPGTPLDPHWIRESLRLNKWTAVDVERGFPCETPQGCRASRSIVRAGSCISLGKTAEPTAQASPVSSCRAIRGWGCDMVSPVRVNQGTSAAVQAFLPTVAMNHDGTGGRPLLRLSQTTWPATRFLSTDVHLSLFTAQLSYFAEHRLTAQSFDMRQMVLTGRAATSQATTMGLSTDGPDFVAAFTTSNNLGLLSISRRTTTACSSTPTTVRASCSCGDRHERERPNGRRVIRAVTAKHEASLRIASAVIDALVFSHHRGQQRRMRPGRPSLASWTAAAPVGFD
jgi:hypothetical protein